MSGNDWRSTHEPRKMLNMLPDAIAPRAVQYFLLAGCRRLLHLMPDERTRRGYLVLEQHIDGFATTDELKYAFVQANAAASELSLARSTPPYRTRQMHTMAAHAIRIALTEESSYTRDLLSAFMATLCICAYDHESGMGSVDTLQHDLANDMRELFENPLEPVLLEPRWLTNDVLGLACTIKRQQSFELMPILADAFMDAGCDDSTILTHCHHPRHLQGCWLIEHVLANNT